jgi:polar amino acid transport system substrate-binding protein
MKSLRRFAYAFTAVAVVVSMSACSASSTKSPSADGTSAESGLPATIRVGAAAGPPFLFRDATGEWTSFSAELAKKFGEYAKVKIEFVDTTFPTMIAGLQTSKYDLTQPINATPERSKVVDFSDGVSAAGALYFSQPGSGFTSIEDMNKPSVTIAVISGSAEEQTTKTLLPKATLRSLPTASVTDLATEVTSGHSNVMVDSSYLAPAIKTAFGFDSTPSYSSTPDGLAPVPIGFSVKKSDTVLLKKLDAFIAEMKASGELEKLKEKWLTIDNALKG